MARGETRRRVALITGASQGVGRATARLFAAEGWDVGLVARGADGLAAAVGEARAAGARAQAACADVSDPEQVERAAAEVEKALGPISVWVNNAMISVFSPVKSMTPEEVRRVTEVNYLGAVNGTLAALRRMLPRDRGVIVQVGSALAYRAIPLQAAYCASKHAIAGFTESLRCELLHDGSGVRVTVVNLPAINTPHFDVVRSRLSLRPRPVPPVYQPELAARAIMAAAAAAPRELNFGRMTSAAILGDKIAPGLLDRYLARVGYRSQLTPRPSMPGRRDNLFDPLPGDRGARGRFGEESASRSPHLWLRVHRRALLSAGAAAAALLVLLRRRAWR